MIFWQQIIKKENIWFCPKMFKEKNKQKSNSKKEIEETLEEKGIHTK